MISPENGRVIRNVEGTKGDVLVFVLSEDGHTRVTIRPSGTEPKIKYYGVMRRATASGMSDEALEQLKQETLTALNACVTSLVAEAEKRG